MAIPGLLSAALTGVVGEVHAVDGIAGTTTYRIYAEFSDPGDRLIAQYGLTGEPMEYNTSTTWFQDVTFGGPTTDLINPSLLVPFPNLAYDSWLTIGREDNTGNNINSVGFDYADFEAGNSWVVDDIVGGVLFALPGDPQTIPLAGRVLIAQLTTDGEIDLLINLQWRDSADVSYEEAGFVVELPVSIPGCDDPDALNYNPAATENDGSCTYPAPSFSGLSFEEVAVDGVAGYTTYRVYANFTNPFDQLVAVYGLDTAPLSVTTTGTFYQDANGGPTSLDINSALFGAFPDLEYDSWFTIGNEENTANGLQLTGTDFSSFNAGGAFTINDAVGGVIYVFPDAQPSAFPDAMGRVLIAQLSTNGFVDLSINLQYRAQDGTNPQEEALTLSFPAQINGCTDPAADNYNPLANVDDGSCLFSGCTNPLATNFDPGANVDDGSCIVPGCTNPLATNFDPTATVDDGSCIVPGCTNPLATNFDPTATVDDGSCIVPGCTNPLATNFDPTATVDDGSCIVPGCTNPLATNFDPTATVDDGSCIIPGCTNVDADNFDPTATVDDGSCIIGGCTYADAANYDIDATYDDGSCDFQCLGCTDPTAFNYNANANTDDGSCIAVVTGCTDATATNYNALANTDDGSCIATIFGCTDGAAFNFDPAANTDNGGCVAVQAGCTNPTANNYAQYANTDDGSCDFTAPCIGDFDQNGSVNGSDLLAFLGVFGTDCP